MPDLITGDVGGLDVNSDQVASGAFEGQEWFKTTRNVVRAADGGAIYRAGFTPEGTQLPAPFQAPSFGTSPEMTAEQANERYGIKSRDPASMPDLSFDRTITETEAQAAAQEWHDKVLRQDALQRTPAGVMNGVLRAGASMAVFALDPLNIAASLIPVVGEAGAAMALTRIGIAAGEGAAARTGVRLATGLISGAANQTPLIALQSAVDADYHSRDAMLDLVMGGVLGAGLHAAIGGAKDWLGRGFRETPHARAVDEDPVVREAAMRTAVGQLADGRPVEVDGVIQVVAAERAEAELHRWAVQRGLISNQEDAALQRTLAIGEPPSREAAIAAAGTRIEGLQGELAGLREEAGRLRIRAGEGTVDPATAERLAEIDREASGTISGARRAALQDEQQMLLHGRPTDEGLDAARTAAELRGVQAQARRTEAALAVAQARHAGLTAAAAQEAAATQAERLAGDRMLRIAEARAASRRAVLDALTTRTLRRFGGAIGAGTDDAAELARMVGAGEITGKDAVRALSERRGGEIRLKTVDEVHDALARASAALRLERDAAMADLAQSPAIAAARGEPAADVIAAEQQASRAVREAPTVLKQERRELPPDTTAQLKEVETALEAAPSWMVANASAAVQLADKLGLIEQIGKLAKEGKTAAEISKALEGKLSASDVRSVRDHLGLQAAGPAGFMGVEIPREGTPAAKLHDLAPGIDPKMLTAEERAALVEALGEGAKLDMAEAGLWQDLGACMLNGGSNAV